MMWIAKGGQKMLVDPGTLPYWESLGWQVDADANAVGDLTQQSAAYDALGAAASAQTAVQGNLNQHTANVSNPHSVAQDQLIDAFGPHDHQMIAWSLDPMPCTVGQGLPAGTLYLVKLRLAKSSAVSNVSYRTTAGSTLTAGQNLVGVYSITPGNPGAGTLLASSADQSTAWTSGTNQFTALTSPTAVLPAGTDLYVGFLANGTTPPGVFGMGTVAAAMGSINYDNTKGARFMTFSTGLTALPASFALVGGSTAAATKPLFVGLA